MEMQIMQMVVISLINISVVVIALALWAFIKWVSKATGKGIIGSIKFIFLSPIKFIKFIKASRKIKREHKQARAYKKVIIEAVDNYLYGPWAENRPEIQNDPNVKAHKDMMDKLKDFELAKSQLQETLNKKKKK